MIAETLAARGLHDGNTAEKPRNIVPLIEHKSLEVRGSATAWTFPAYSFTLLRIEYGRRQAAAGKTRMKV